VVCVIKFGTRGLGWLGAVGGEVGVLGWTGACVVVGVPMFGICTTLPNWVRMDGSVINSRIAYAVGALTLCMLWCRQAIGRTHEKIKEWKCDKKIKNIKK
jgi:hypothetical protein